MIFLFLSYLTSNIREMLVLTRRWDALFCKTCLNSPRREFEMYYEYSLCMAPVRVRWVYLLL